MSKFVFPTENEVGLVFGKSPRILLEKALANWQRYTSSCTIEAFVYQGQTLSAGSGLAVNVASGDAVINGYWINSDATETHSALAVNRTIEAPNFVFAQLTRSGVDSRIVSPGYLLVSNTTGTAPVDSVLLGIAATSASAVSQVMNVPSKPRIVTGTYLGDDTASRFIFVGFTPKFVIVEGPWKQDTLNWDAYSFSGLDIGSSLKGVRILLDTLTPAELPHISASKEDRPEITTWGFIVGQSSNQGINQGTGSPETYRYLAWA